MQFTVCVELMKEACLGGKSSPCLFVCVFYSVNQIKYNTILFYIIYKRERLKR